MPIDPPIPTEYNNLELCKLTFRKFCEIGTFMFKYWDCTLPQQAHNQAFNSDSLKGNTFFI